MLNARTITKVKVGAGVREIQRSCSEVVMFAMSLEGIWFSWKCLIYLLPQSPSHTDSGYHLGMCPYSWPRESIPSMVLEEVTALSPFQSQMPEPTGPNKKETKRQRAEGDWVKDVQAFLQVGTAMRRRLQTSPWESVMVHRMRQVSRDGLNESQRIPNEVPLSVQ